MADETSTTVAPAPAAQTETTTPTGTPFEQAVAYLKTAQAETPPATPAPSQSGSTEATTATKAPEVPAQEGKTTETVAEPPKTPDLDARLQKLIEAQKQTRLEREQFEAAKKQHDAEIAWAKKVLEDPLNALSEKGLSYEKLTEMALDPKRAQLERTDKKTLSEVEQLRAQVEELKTHNQQVKAEAARSNALAQTKAMTANGDDFELVKAYGAEERALQLVEQHYTQTGQMLGGGTLEEAIHLSLGTLEKAFEADLDKGLTTKKVKSKLSTVAPTQSSTPAAANSGQRQSPKTLTNSQAPTQPRSGPENLSVEELRAKALEILQRS